MAPPGSYAAFMGKQVTSGNQQGQEEEDWTPEREDMGFWREDRVLERKDGVLVRKDKDSREKNSRKFQSNDGVPEKKQGSRKKMGFQSKDWVPEKGKVLERGWDSRRKLSTTLSSAFILDHWPHWTTWKDPLPLLHSPHPQYKEKKAAKVKLPARQGASFLIYEKASK